MKLNLSNKHICFAVIAILTTGLAAQNIHQPPQPPMVPDSTQIIQMVNEIASALSLSATQKVQISDLYFAHFEDIKTMTRQAEKDRENHHKIMDSKRTEFENQVKAVLTNKQKAEFEKMPRQRPPQPENNRPSKPQKEKRRK